MLSSTYQSTDHPLLSTLYKPLSKHLISVLVRQQGRQMLLKPIGEPQRVTGRGHDPCDVVDQALRQRQGTIADGERRHGRTNKEVVVIAHQAVGKALPVLLRADEGEKLK